ncbi:MAG: energy transducer TonB, partial [Bacteroidaceae bacterium]|nr:energy transducer TonB [Bacteroidaceae bacterium]
ELVVWLNKNIMYPNDAINRKIKGAVEVGFFIEKDGSLTDFKVVKSAHTLLDEEALRVCKQMPKWKPGKIKGKVCRTFFVIPVNFDLLK